MSRVALIISREQIKELDSRFLWTSSLREGDFSGEKVFILHDSADDDVTLLSELSKLYKKDKNKKFLYINSEPSPLMTSYFYGIQGITIDDDFPLSDPDFLLDLIEEYDKSEFRLKTPQEEFSGFTKAMNRILEGDLDEEELHEILTNEGWLSQIKASVETISTSLTLVDTSRKELTVYVDHSREMLAKFVSELESTKMKLKDAMLMGNKFEQSTSDATRRNKITLYPQVPVPLSAQHILYVQELTPCIYLTSFLAAYTYYLNRRVGKKTRLLIVHPNAASDADRYPAQSFYSLNNMSIGQTPPAGTDLFVTSEPKQNIISYFFDEPNTKCFIVLDRLQQGDAVLRSCRNMRFLWASNNLSILQKKVSDMRKTICGLRPEDDGGINIPFIAGYKNGNFVGSYYRTCKGTFAEIDKMLGIDDDE